MRTIYNITEKQLYKCEICDHIWCRKYDYENHLKTRKHENRKIKKHENEINLLSSTSCKKKMKTEYYCDYCQFYTTVRKEAVKHRKSKQHTQNNNNNVELLEITNKYVCLSCDKSFKYYKTCWGHSKNCQGKKENIVIETIVTPAEICLPIKKEKPKRKTIPLALRRSVWNKYIGEEIGKTLCLCCKISDISQMTFSCGHIVSVYNGGDINLDNLKPICVSCNSSMGTQNMDEFIQKYRL